MTIVLRRFFSILSVIILFLFIFTPRANAAEDNKRWVCLNSQHCWSNAAGYEACSAAHKGNGHVSRLTTKPGFEPIAGIPTYIVECVATSNDQICTTGNTTADVELYGSPPPLASLEAQLGYKFEGLFKGDGTTSSPNPTIWEGAYEWGDSTPAGHSRRWYAMNFYDPTDFAAEGTGGQQQGTFDFETAERDCISISWDPYGRIFDPSTLEPVAGALVTLYVKKGDTFKVMDRNDLVGGSIINPQTTLEDGNYSFVIPDGDYKLEVTPPAVTDIAQVHPNYAKAYSDIYPASTGELIQQRGAIQHRDIPITTASYSATPKMMEYFYDVKDNGKAYVTGRVSHPLSRLIAGSSKVSTTNPDNKTPYRNLGTFYADKLGKFSIELDQTKFEKTEEYVEVFSDLEIQKVDLRENAVVFRKNENILEKIAALIRDAFQGIVIQAQSKSTIVKFDPIPRYLEGYAYDGNNKPLPNTTVGVYQKFSSKPYSQTTTDTKGYFKFASQSLPTTTYIIKYKSPNGATVTASTSKFLAQNQKYMVKNKVNPYVAKDNAGTGVQPASSAGLSSASGHSNGAPSTFGGGPVQKSGSISSKSGLTSSNMQSSANPFILVFILLIILLVGVGAGVLLYMKNKQPAASAW